MKKIGIGLLMVPLGFLLMFTFGEVFSGDFSGLSHLIQALPIALLLWLAFKKPFVAGVILVGVGVVSGIVYALSVPFEALTILIVEGLLFVPPVVSGALLILSEKKKRFSKD